METKTSKTLASKVAKIMGEIDHVEKDGRNQAQGYDFVSAAAMAHLLRGKLAENKIALFSDEQECVDGEFTTAKGGIMHTSRIKTVYTLVDGDTGESISFGAYASAFDSGDKAIYKAKTASLKYALRQTFIVPDKSDPEADEQVDNRKNQKAVIGCDECGEVVTPFRKPNGTISSVEQIVNASIAKHKKTLCAQCQLDIAAIEKQERKPSQEEVSEPDGELIMVAEIQDTLKGYKKIKYHAPGSMGELEASLWDKKLWPLFELPAGKKFVVKFEKKESKGRTYTNIVDVLKVGEYAVENGELVVHLNSKDTEFVTA